MRTPEQNDIDKRRWVSGAELTELDRMPSDPTLESDLHGMGGEMIDPWAE